MKENLIGQQFGHLTVIDYNENNKKWICKCDCGNMTEGVTSNLKLGNTKSCGHLKNAKGVRKHKDINIMNEQIGQLYVKDVNKDTGFATVKCLQCNKTSKMLIEDLIKMKKTRKKSFTCGINGCKYKEKRKRNKTIRTGTKFGNLTVLMRLENKIVKTEKSTTSIPMYLCECQCGNQVEVQGRYLLDGRTKSCGCLRQKNFLDKNTHKNTTLSSSNKKLYKIYIGWQQKYRQPTKTFQKKVIDKGIKFFPELKDVDDPFKRFSGWAQINGFSIKEGRIYLDRKDYNKDFNVTNCFWTNKRTRGY